MEDNASLLKRVRGGDKQAEKIMVEKNMGLVMSVAKRYSSRGLDGEDIVQIGAIGLIKAVKKFNPDFKVQFSTYAVPLIAGEIKRFLRDDGTVKISRALKEKALKGRRCEEALRKRLFRQPTISEISEESGIDAGELLEAFEAAAPPDSIDDSAFRTPDKEISLGEMIGGGEIEDKVINKVMVDEMLKSLSDREKEIILLRYFRGKTQTEIAKYIGVSQVQISRIEKKAMEKVRSVMSG